MNPIWPIHILKQLGHFKVALFFFFNLNFEYIFWVSLPGMATRVAN